MSNFYRKPKQPFIRNVTIYFKIYYNLFVVVCRALWRILRANMENVPENALKDGNEGCSAYNFRSTPSYISHLGLR